MKIIGLIDDDPQAVRARLVERYGQPRRLPDDVEGLVLVFGHASRAAAYAFALADRRVFGHPAERELREGVGWVSVVDLRPALAELDWRRLSRGGGVPSSGAPVETLPRVRPGPGPGGVRPRG